MACSIPVLDKLFHRLGYESACIVHDMDYENAISYRHKFKVDVVMMKNMITFVPKWYSYPVGFASLVALSVNPFSYYLYFRNKHNKAGHVLSAMWLFISIYSMWSMYG